MYNGVMSAFSIKIIALLTMVLDHMGIFLFPNVFWLRSIGRLSFPLFAWLISNGAKHTKNFNAYMRRLFIFGLVSQIPFLLANRTVQPDFSDLNIMFTLLTGLLAIKVWISALGKSKKYFLIFLLVAVSHITKMDYGPAGVLSILFFYIFSESSWKMLLSQVVAFTLVFPLQVSLRVGQINFFNLFQSLALFSLIFIGQYNFKPGPRVKYLFYIFYPVHFIVFYVLRMLY